MSVIQRGSIEYNLTEHCNLKCLGCDHNSPVMPEKFADLASFRREMTALSSALHVQQINLIGGEPLLHPEIHRFMEAARETGIADLVAIVTNGTLLHRAPEIVWQLADQIIMTRYPGVNIPMSEDDLIAKCRQHDIELIVHRADKFRATLLNNVISDPETIRQIYDSCYIAHVYGCHSVYEGRYYKCSPAPFVPQRLHMVGRGVGDWSADGIVIADNPNLRQELEQYLASAEPLQACSGCLGTAGVLHDHQQLNKAARQAWLDEDHTEVNRLIDREHLVRRRYAAGEVALDRTHESTTLT